MDEDLPNSVDDNDSSDNDDDNDGVGIDEDNNDDDEAGEYVNTSRLCERPAGCLLHSFFRAQRAKRAVLSFTECSTTVHHLVPV